MRVNGGMAIGIPPCTDSHTCHSFDLFETLTHNPGVATWSNWAGTARARPAHVATPRTLDELRDAVAAGARRGLPIRAVGSGHSFSEVAVTDGVQLRLDALSGVVDADPASGCVTVLAGTRLSDLNDELWRHGLALSNLGDVDVQTVSGAISTGTHGTGADHPGLASAVRALTLVRPDGSLLACSADSEPEVFAAARIAMGALGVLATVTLQCEPAFLLRAMESTGRLEEVLPAFEEVMSEGDHVEFYWFPHTRRVLRKCNNRVSPDTRPRPLGRVRGWFEDEFLSNTVFEATNRLAAARPAVIPHLNAVSARALTRRQYTDRSYRVFVSPRRVVFTEMEYAVPRAALPAVIEEVDAWLRRSGERVAFPVEVRVAAADDVWLSPAYGRDVAYLAVHQYARRPHARYFAAVEDIATAAGGRPHWGKLHSRDAVSLRPVYPRFDDFRAVRDRLDPERTFANAYLDRVLGP